MIEYNLSEVTRYAVNCENCEAGTGNHSQADTAHKSARQKGFIAIATAEAGTINLCPACIPADVAKFFVTANETVNEKGQKTFETTDEPKGPRDEEPGALPLA
jgi:hypothetical protein